MLPILGTNRTTSISVGQVLAYTSDPAPHWGTNGEDDPAREQRPYLRPSRSLRTESPFIIFRISWNCLTS
jgi:hypothetical protein